MDELEDQLRAEVHRHTGEFTPSPDLPERIHAQVKQRRRQRALLTGALSSVALVGVVVAGLLLTRPSDGQSVEMAEDGSQVTTVPPTPQPPAGGSSEVPPQTSQPPQTTEVPATTAPPETTETIPPPTTSEPPPDTTVDAGLRPPDAQTPVAGVCGQAAGSVVEVVANPDIPSPRCTKVTPDQRLQVRNQTDGEITVSLADFSATLAPGEAQVFDRPFGEYLQPGVHRVTMSLYGGSGAEIWLDG